MKIIVTVEKGVNVEVQPDEGQQVSITDIVASLEFAKTLALGSWHEAILKGEQVEADAENNETSGD